MTGTAALNLTIRNDLAEIGRLAEEVEAFCEAKGLGGGIAHALNLSLDELLANTISYGYDDAAIHAIEVSLSATPGGVTMVIRDDARAFDPTLAPDPDIDAELDDRPIGGLGIHIVRAMMDEIDYQRVDGRNLLTLVKRLDAS